MTWSRQRWLVVAALIFLGQVGAILALHTRRPMLARIPTVRTVQPGPGTGSASEILASPAQPVWDDPMAFAGAHAAGFSAAAWLESASMDYVISNSAPPPAFLAFRRMSPMESAAKPPPAQASALSLLQFKVPSDSPGRSRVFVEGNLADRPMVKDPSVPGQFGGDVLSNSIVQVSVQADGFPVLSRLISGSGSRVADLKALEIANGIRFAPKPLRGADRDETLETGRLVFEWFTAELSATNAPAGPIK